MVKPDSHYVKLLTNIVALLLYLLCITDIVFCKSSSAFEEGRFCNIFHPDATGWRDCHTCKKVSWKLLDIFLPHISLIVHIFSSQRHLIGNSNRITTLIMLMINLSLQLVHCGCIMSAHTYELLECGDGIRCTECIRNDILSVGRCCLSLIF